MVGSLREDAHLICGDVVVNSTGTVLQYHGGCQGANDDDVQLGTTRMDVRSVETTWTEKTHGHTGAGSDESWHGLSVGSDGSSGVSSSNVEVAWWVSEVKLEVKVGEELDTIGLERSYDELCDQVQVAVS